MSKRFLLVVAIVALMAPMSAQACITTWIFGDDDMYGARVGWQDEAAGIEAGITSWWFESEPKSYGVYGIWHLADPVELPNFFGIGPEYLQAFPYIGAQVSASIDSDDHLVAAWDQTVRQIAAQYFLKHWSNSLYGTGQWRRRSPRHLP